MKQPFILTLVSSVACAVTAANKAPENTTPTKSKTPNVVFIYADDLATAIWNVTELKNVQTPNVNRLAKSGILFTNAHATAATSTPSRYSMLTGEYAWRKEGTDVAAGNAGMIIRPEQYTMQTCLKVPDMLQPPSANGIWAWETRQADRIGMLLYQRFR